MNTNYFWRAIDYLDQRSAGLTIIAAILVILLFLWVTLWPMVPNLSNIIQVIMHR